MSDWQPIDTAPKDGSWILLTGGKDAQGWDHDEPQPPMVVAQWASYAECWQFAWYDSGYYGEYDQPTHWLPLPQPLQLNRTSSGEEPSFAA